jgi:hypothetical protein
LINYIESKKWSSFRRTPESDGSFHPERDSGVRFLFPSFPRKRESMVDTAKVNPPSRFRGDDGLLFGIEFAIRFDMN